MPHSIPEVAAAGRASRTRWAGLAGREHGEASPAPPLVLLHGLTFDRRMWDPILELLPDRRRAIAFDLPGHGASPPVPGRGLSAVVEAVHEAVVDAGLVEPVVVGHSFGGALAAIYAATFPAAGVVSVEAPIRLEPFAALLASIRPQLIGDRFAEVWSGFRQSWQMDRVPPAYRPLLRAGERASQDVVLAYQADLLERPLPEVVSWRDRGLEELKRKRTPYVSLHAGAVDPAERDWLLERVPQAEVVVWPVGHHFPHLADPGRFAGLLGDLAAAAAG